MGDVEPTYGAVIAPAAATSTPLGYLVVFHNSGITTIDSITSSDKICGSRTTLERLSSHSVLSRASQGVVSAGELYPALQTGACDAAVVSDAARAGRILPPDQFRFIEIH